MNAGELAFEIVQPSKAILFIFVAGLVALAVRPRTAVVLLAAGAALYIVCGTLPISQMILRPLEARFPFRGIIEAPDAIIVLGGFLEPTKTERTHRVALNDRAERITEAAALARRFPEAQVVVSDGAVARGRPSGAELAAALLRELGVTPDRIVLETRARSTWDNARLTRDILDPPPDWRYVLVTSGWHMPRAVGAFRAAGWPEPIAWPVDPADNGEPLWRAVPQSPALGLAATDLAARELLALVYYRLAGRSGALVPGPIAETRGAPPVQPAQPVGPAPGGGSGPDGAT